MRKIFFLALLCCAGALLAGENDAEQHYKRGAGLFFEGKFTESLAEFDAEIKADPARAPQHWQRGIALYYAGRFDDGRKQFESHREVNPNDVENAAWHFLCAAKASGVEAARAKLIPIDLTRDTRVPMQQIYELFKGSGTEQDVLAAAQAGNPSAEQLKNNLCYAHLYLGLYADALGRKESEREHMHKAALDFKQGHYMGLVAQVHDKFKLK